MVTNITYAPDHLGRAYAGASVVRRLIATFADLPENELRDVLVVAYCESAGWVHRYPSGELRLHAKRASSARGVMQVLAELHAPELRKRKLDLRNDDHYFRFVRILYDRGGLRPWRSSFPCVAGKTELGRKARAKLDALLMSPGLASLM